MKYKNIIGVNENFQYSVNLQFDINNISKIKEYIPTKDACELLKKYFNSVINSKNRASMLIGPYGKGKSHLLLVLITLLSNYNSDDEIEINNLINKIKRVDEELYNILIEIRTKKIKLMPIIINSNYADLNQAFLLALSESLERENISDIVVKTYFDIALNVILKWEERDKEIIEQLKKCLSEQDYTLKELKQGLKNYSEKYYDAFKKVYSCILHGQEFNPLVNSDLVKTYKDMTYEIKKYGFDGIFIVFDEFSKFLEYSESSHIMKDLKLLQDFAELANRTGTDEQIHLSCITHKAMNQYTKNLSDDKINAFRTVEGRFKELYFNRSIEQNYEIVSYALSKKSQFDLYYQSFFDENLKFYLDVKENSIFKNIDNIEDILFKGCFPLNPITVYCLIQLSERIAQNERTLFTFLTDDDQNGLKYFIENNDSGLFNASKIYDYFKPIFKKENDSLIKDIWLKSENALGKCNENIEKDIIKVIAIIYMVNEIEILVPDDMTIRSALQLDEKKYIEIINKLIEKSVIKRKKITNELDFTTMYNRELSKEIKRLSEEQYYDVNLKDTINEVITKTYSLPRRYNDEYKITRFFLNIFMTEKELQEIRNFDILFENNYCDGIIINLIRESRNVQIVKDYFKECDNDRIVLKIPKTVFPKTLISLLREYKSIKYLMNNFIKNESNNELEIMKKETVELLDEQLNMYFSEDNIQEYIYRNKSEKKIKNLSSFLSDICTSVYSGTPIINNEMINKRDLSAPIKKARDIVIETILNDDKSLIKSRTSAEATIYKAIVEKKENKSIKHIINIIDDFISKSENNKISFDKLYKKLESKPYSLRKGIIPILISISLYNYSDIIVVYFMNKEIDLNANNLVKINENPDKYFILTEKGTTDKIKYLSNLMCIFNITNIDNQRVNLKKLVDAMKKWILSLPRILREYTTDYDYLKVKKEYIDVKNELLKPDINNNEFIYKNLIDIFKTTNLDEICNNISTMKKFFDHFMDDYSELLIEKTKKMFNSKFKGGLNSLLKEWFSNNKLDNSPMVYDLKTKQLIDYIKDLTTHDEKDIIEGISRIITGFYIEDWSPSEIQNYETGLEMIIDRIKDIDNITPNESNKITLIYGDETVEKYINSEDKISAIGNTMKNNIEEIINEYGESLSEQEKISILIDIVRQYM